MYCINDQIGPKQVHKYTEPSMGQYMNYPTKYGDSNYTYSNMLHKHWQSLQVVIQDIKKNHPNVGYKMMEGHLRSRVFFGPEAKTTKHDAQLMHMVLLNIVQLL